MAKAKAEIFECLEEMGCQYRTKHGGIVTIGYGDLTIDADVATMYVVKGPKKILKFGWKEVYEDLPPAASPKELEAAEFKKSAAKNVKYKEKMDEEG